jgi:hypothetical protein
MDRRSNIIIAVIISLLVLFSSFSYWYSKNILHTTTFTQTLNTALLSDESKKAISSEVVDKALQRRPLIKEFLGDTGRSAVYALLGTQYFESAFTTLASHVHARMLSAEDQDLSINIITIKQIALPIIGRLRPELSENLNANQIPDKIVIINQSSIPDLYKYTPYILWGGWASLMGLILLTIYYFYKNNDRSSTLKTLGVIMVAVFLLAIISTSTLLSLLTANIPSPNLHIVADNVISAFSASFIRQLSLLTLLGVILLLLGYAYPFVETAILDARKSLPNGKRK